MTKPRSSTALAPAPRPGAPYGCYGVIDAVARNVAASGARPFRDIDLVLLLHLRPSLLAIVRAVVALGAAPERILVFKKDYDYPELALVESELWRLGVVAVAIEHADEALEAFRSKAAGRPVIVVEDGGHVLPRIHADPLLLGGVEQTTKGMRRFREAVPTFDKPLLDLPASRFKQKFEPYHVAAASVAAIERALGDGLPLQDFDVAVIGAGGTIGGEIANMIATRARSTRVFDAKDTSTFRLCASGRHVVCDSFREAVRGCRVVVSCTGENVMSAASVNALEDGTILASTGSERTEFPVDLLRQLGTYEPVHNGTLLTLGHNGRRLLLLNDGRPVNFSAYAPPEPKCFDLVMAAILVGAIELVQGRYAGLAGPINCFDGVVERHNLDLLYLAVHEGEASP